MFHTEPNRVIHTFRSEWVLLRWDAGECHNLLYRRSPVDLLLPELNAVLTPKSLRFYPVHRWQLSRLNDTARIGVQPGLSVFRIRSGPPSSVNGMMPEGNSR